MTNKPSWRDELRILLNDWVKRMVALGELNEPKRNGGFTLYECPDIEPFIQDLLDRKAREIEEHGYRKNEPGWEKISTEVKFYGMGYNDALDQALSILKDNHES